jgi:hypothetical protein
MDLDGDVGGAKKMKGIRMQKEDMEDSSPDLYVIIEMGYSRSHIHNSGLG